MTKLRQFLGGLICALGGWLLTACSSDEDSLQIPEGKGYVKLNLTADAGFQTKAVDESDYTKLENYTVQILKDGNVVNGMEWNYNEIPDEKLIELTNGDYVLKAFYGEVYDVPSSRDGIYMEGIKNFNVNGDQQNLTVECKPVQAKIQVNFDAKMKDYFSDYYVTFETEALGNNKALWGKDDTSPLYLKVNANGEDVVATFTLNKTTGGQATVDPKKYNLKPLDFQTINIAPVVESNTGNVGISITINKETNDEEIEIEIPKDWVN